MKVVVDTNVFVSALVSNHGASMDIIRRAFSDHFELICSGALLEEVHRILNLPRISRRVQRDDGWQERHVAELRNMAVIVTPRETAAGATRDAEDAMVLGTAMAGHAEFIVTGDSDLLVLGSYEGIEIVTPRRFAEILDERESRGH